MIINYYNRELIDAGAFSLHDYVVKKFLFETDEIKMNVEYIEKRISSNVCIRMSRIITFSGIDRFEYIFSSEKARSNEIFCMECIDSQNVEQQMNLKILFSNGSYMYIRCQKVNFETISNSTEGAF